MKVLHVIDTIARTSGGPARSCQGLVTALGDAGVDVSLLSLKSGEKPWHSGVKKYFNDVDFVTLLNREKPDLVHMNNFWRPELHKCVKICRTLGFPYIMTPRGCLEPWSLKQKWLKKRIARFLYQDTDMRGAVALHATAESEAKQFRKLGFTNPTIISPNGVNLPSVLKPCEKKNRQQRALFVSRMHPKKGVIELVDAWSRVGIKGWKCELVYTMSCDFEKEYETKVKARVRALGLEDEFIFTGALNDDEKWEAYARADFFVLPTYSENFGIVVAEALYAGVPVITTKGAPWQELEERNCGLWIDIGAEPLESSLKSMIELTDAERREMGARGRSLVEEKYTWDAIGRDMVKAYEAILSKRI